MQRRRLVLYATYRISTDLYVPRARYVTFCAAIA